MHVVLLVVLGFFAGLLGALTGTGSTVFALLSLRVPRAKEVDDDL